MNYQHKELAAGKWNAMSFLEQMGNIGSEISRTIQWSDKDEKLSKEAFERALELLDMTIGDQKNKNKLKELCVLREMLADCFYFDNKYNSNHQQWNDYFYTFAYASAVAKGF